MHQTTCSAAPKPGLTPYPAPWWLPGGHAQTMWAALVSARPPIAYDRRERWTTPDDDFIDVDRFDPRDPSLPTVLLFHGLEGSSTSHYACALMAALRERGWGGAVAHFRGCSGEPNRQPRAYHSGDSAEIDWIVRRLRRDIGQATLYVAGVSLGGNALVKWLGEQGDAASSLVQAAAAVCAPLDLAAGAKALSTGVSRVYTRMFLQTLIPKSLAKLQHFPGLLDAEAVRQARDFYQFDTVVTARLHGFADCWDYWQRSSGKQFLPAIRVPTLVLNARNDPFQPAHVLPDAGQASRAVCLEQPAQGGHVGFPIGHPPGHLGWLPQRLLTFFESGQ